jgi:hypothetical protein
MHRPRRILARANWSVLILTFPSSAPRHVLGFYIATRVHGPWNAPPRQRREKALFLCPTEQSSTNHQKATVKSGYRYPCKSDRNIIMRSECPRPAKNDGDVVVNPGLEAVTEALFFLAGSDDWPEQPPSLSHGSTNSTPHSQELGPTSLHLHLRLPLPPRPAVDNGSHTLHQHSQSTMSASASKKYAVDFLSFVNASPTRKLPVHGGV